MLQAAAAAAALLFIPISLFADDLQNCDSTLQAPLRSSGIMKVVEKLSVLATVEWKRS